MIFEAAAGKAQKPAITLTELIWITVILSIGMASTYFYLREARQFHPGEPSMLALEATDTLTVGQRAPDFQLEAYPGGSLRLSDFAGNKRVVLAFYPNDDEWRGAAEMRSLSRAINLKKPIDTQVLGIAFDSLDDHRRLATRFHLSQKLLSDETGAVARTYGIVNSHQMPRLVMFFINKQGVIETILEGRAGNNDSIGLLADP